MKRTLVVSLLPLAAFAGAQSINSSATATYGLSPAVNGGSNTVYGSLGDVFNPFPPVTAHAVANYDLDTSDGFRAGRTDAIASTDFDTASAGYGFSVDNALYFYLSGNTYQDASDELTLTNTEGATQGKYRVVLSFAKTGNLPELTASGGFAGFGVTNVTSNKTFYSPEMTFSYDSPIATGLSFSSTATSGLDFGSFSSGFRSGAIGMSARIEITDLGGATSFSSFSQSGYGYNVQAVPEPGSMAALAVGAVGLLRRRFRKGA